MADQGIDPRYAAQFQRGFDPARHSVAPVPVAAPREAPVRLPAGPMASARRIDEVRAVAVHETPASELESSAVEPEPHDPDAPSSRAVIAERILLIAGLVLVIVAVVLFWQSATDVATWTGVVDSRTQALALVRNGLPGPLLVAGVVAVVAGTILQALRRRS